MEREIDMKPLKILVIDDNAEQAEILHTILKAEGRDVKVSTESEEALKLIHQNNFDIVFTDVSMPKVDGLEVLKYTKKHSPKTYVILITAFGDWGVYAESIKEGAAEFINKPYNIPEIQNAVERVANLLKTSSSDK